MTVVQSSDQRTSEITLRTETGVWIPMDRFNALQGELYAERHLKLRAFQALRGLCGGEARDFNRLQAILETDNGVQQLTPGIAVRISEADKDWAVPTNGCMSYSP